MRICIFGAGAIGGLIAARLALAGEDVTVIGRGAHLAAIKAKGIALHWQDGRVETAGQGRRCWRQRRRTGPRRARGQGAFARAGGR